MNKKFSDVAMVDNNKWKKAIHRERELYSRENDMRSDFGRDYTRILHSLAYRRLKHKTQVFFNTRNDHICTRMEHVAHVESISYTIAKELGLNFELTKAIAIGHDLGHAPFGHKGEQIIKKLTKEHLNDSFWHEKNGLRVVDKLDLLQDNKGNFANLNLTYAVRDGIVCHCGEVDENAIIPRSDTIDLNQIENPGEVQPFTWEGCIVKISDKIAYLGRDIEDALLLNIIKQ
ncbi:HD domain-containing protein, partial [Intestinibacter sp.]